MVYTTVRIHIRPGGVSRQFCVSRVCTVRCAPVYVRFRGGTHAEQGLFLLCLACGIKPLQLNIPFLYKTSLVLGCHFSF